MSVACGKCTVEVAVRRRDRQTGRERDRQRNELTYGQTKRNEQTVSGTGKETEDKQTDTEETVRQTEADK